MQSRDSNTPGDGNKQLPATQPPGSMVAPWSQDYGANEIDLVDLGVLLWRRRRLMLVVFLVFLVLTFVGTLIKRPTYEYTTSIQLGSMVTQSGILIFPVATEAAVNAMQTSYIPDAINSYASDHKTDLQTLQVMVSAGTSNGTGGGNLISLTCKVKARLAAACAAVEQEAADTFIKGNSRSIDTVRANLQAQVDTAKLTLASLVNPDVFAVQKLAAQQAITSARNTLTSLQSEATVLRVNRSKLEASGALYQKQAAQLESHISEVRKSVVTAGRGTSSPTEAMSNLVLGTEIQRNVNLLNTIQQNLTVSIPEQLASVGKNLSDNARSQALQQQVIMQNEAALKKLLFDNNNAIQNQQVILQNVQAQLANVVDNRRLGAPLRSLNPVGLGRAAVFGIGFILSIILAFIAAFAATYVDQVRARLTIRSES